MTGLPRVRAVTVRQPWAQLVADGIAPVLSLPHNTTWRGVLYVHAAANPDLGALNLPHVIEALNACDSFTRTDTEHLDWLTYGAVVAVGRLIDVHDPVAQPALFGEPGVCCEPWGAVRAPGGRRARHWVLADVFRLGYPVTAVGRPSLWTPDARLIRHVTEVLPTEVPA